MGFLINPEIFRINFDNYWKSTWTNNSKKSYRIASYEDILLNKVLTHTIKNNTFYNFGVAISHYTLNKKYNQLFVNVYIYDSKDFLEVYKNDYAENKFQFFEKKKDVISIKWNEKTTLFSKTMISSLIWRMFEKTLQIGLLKLNGVKLRLNVIRLQSNNVTPTFIVNYISFKLKQKYSLPWILRPILRDLQAKKNQNKIRGFKLLYAGRFTRKQIADYSWTTLGKTSLNTLSSKVKLGQGQVRLKYGICGFKLWIDYTNTSGYKKKKKFIYPFVLPTQFFYKNEILNLSNISWQKKYLNNCGFSFIKADAYKNLIKSSLRKLIFKKATTNKLYVQNSTELILKKQQNNSIIYE